MWGLRWSGCACRGRGVCPWFDVELERWDFDGFVDGLDEGIRGQSDMCERRLKL